MPHRGDLLDASAVGRMSYAERVEAHLTHDIVVAAY